MNKFSKTEEKVLTKVLGAVIQCMDKQPNGNYKENYESFMLGLTAEEMTNLDEIYHKLTY